MADWICPDCGAEHHCQPEEPTVIKGPGVEARDRGGKGYSLYYVSCRCGCGCGHTCDLIYGPYAKVYNSRGAAAMQGELGDQIKRMREASLAVRKEHLARLHT